MIFLIWYLIGFSVCVAVLLLDWYTGKIDISTKDLSAALFLGLFGPVLFIGLILMMLDNDTIILKKRD